MKHFEEIFFEELAKVDCKNDVAIVKEQCAVSLRATAAAIRAIGVAAKASSEAAARVAGVAASVLTKSVFMTFAEEAKEAAHELEAGASRLENGDQEG